tara:strand:+ start:641 stop:1291 length:651 start_codon:yes stop_codon:yes gene_type:complete
MDNFDLRKYLAEGRLLKEEVYVDFEGDLSEVTVYGFGQQFTGVETSDGKYYFIHYFDDVGGDDSVPFLFDYLKKIGGKMEIDEEEITLEIDYNNLRPLINENKLLKEAKMGEPLNDRGLLNLIQQNMKDVLVAIDATPEDPTDVEIDFDGDGDPSIVIDGITGYSFRRPEDVDHVGPIGMETVDDGYSKPFEGQDGDEPRPIKIGGKDLMYIAYNI